jgi:serine protease Do
MMLAAWFPTQGLGLANTAAAQPSAAIGTMHRAPDFSALAEQVGSAVVNISTVQVRPQAKGDAPKGGDPFHDFRRRFGPQAKPEERAVPREGQGSGFIVSGDGYILTNAHVVADATVVTVRLTDKREFKAKVIGTDKRTDVALLKVDATGLPTVKLGDASRVKVGEWVMAVGSPFGFDSTVTAGIVSAKSRNLPDETLVPFIQTDVAINPGNSGGPLFNLDGEVIGINSQIYSRTGGYQGLSFAIPIDVAMQVKDQLQNHGRVSRGKLGVYIQPLTPELAQSFGVARPAGALVSSVEKGGPAERAGVQPGDVVMAVNGQPVEANVDLPRIIFSLRPGETVKLRLWRQNATLEIPVNLGELEPARTAAADPVEPATTGKLGLALRPLVAAEARELDVANGLLVERADGAAAKAGLQRGDVVLAVNGEPVFSVEQFRGLVTRAGSQIALLIQRGDSRLFVPVRIS